MQPTAKSDADILAGVLRLNSKGVGFLEHEGYEEDIEIQNNLLNTALQGDEVEIQIVSRKSGERIQGEVLKVLKRIKTEFVGTIDITPTATFIIPDDRKMYRDIFIPNGIEAKYTGYKALAKLTMWVDHKKDPQGEILQIIGKKGEHNTEIESIVLDRGIKTGFPPEVEKEAQAIEKREKPIAESEIAKRKDLRQTVTFTIDPADAKDFDDAISFKDLGDGTYEIGVHIADVSHYVTPGTALDKEAERRGFSVYLVDRTIPMLPEVLSNDLCSLNPREDKLAFSAVFVINDKAEVLSRWFGKSVINSNTRFSYEDAQKVLDEKAGPHATELEVLNRIAKIFQKEKMAAGAIDFETEEVRFELDEKGVPIRIYKKQRLDTHKLVEEYMLLANREVAEYVHKKVMNLSGDAGTFIYRIHDLPNPEKLANLSVFVRALGFDLPSTAKITAKQIKKLLDEVAGTPQESLIKTATIRSMAKAVYSTKNIGHFGLAFSYYTHFTSPIRRYADLMVHRLLQAHLTGGKIASGTVIAYQKLAEGMTDKEINAADAERTSIKLKQVEFMSRKVGQTFDGIISGVTDWGVYIEETETKSEGMVSLRNMRDDFYEFKPKEYAIVGQKTKKRYALGDKVKVKVVGTDVERKVIDYAFA